MVYFCLRNDSGRSQWNQYVYKVSINFFILICDFIKTLSSLHSETADVIWPPWNDQMLLLHKILWHNLMKSFLMQHSYFHFQEIFMKYLWYLMILYELWRKCLLWNYIKYYCTFRGNCDTCSVALLKKEEMCWLITSNGLSVAISTYFIVMFRQESDNNSLQLSQKPSLAKSSW